MPDPSPGPRARLLARLLARPVALVGIVVLAAVAGVTGAFVHRTRVELLGVTVPVGLVAVVGATVALVLLARLVGRSRTAVLVVGAALGLPILVLSQFRPEGDLVVNQDVWGLTLLGSVALVLTAAVVVPFTTYDGPPAAPPARPGPPDDEQVPPGKEAPTSPSQKTRAPS